jgi:hypothetical protein
MSRLIRFYLSCCGYSIFETDFGTGTHGGQAPKHMTKPRTMLHSEANCQETDVGIRANILDKHPSTTMHSGHNPLDLASSASMLA